MGRLSSVRNNAVNGSLYPEESNYFSSSDFSDVELRKSVDNAPEIAHKETVTVNRLRLVVALVLIASTIGAAVTVFQFTSNSEISQFEDQFHEDAYKVLQAIGSSMEDTKAALDGFVANMVSFARYTNQTWPFVTIPDFAIRASKVRTLSEGVGIFLQPIVTPEERLEWEQYAYDHRYWVNESMKLQENAEDYFGPIIYDSEIRRSIFNDFSPVPYNSTRLMMPQWQCYPAIPKWEPAYGWDWLSQNDPSSVYSSIEKHKAILSKPYMLPDPNDAYEMAENEYWVDWYSEFIRPDENANEPMSDLHYPVIDKLDAIRTVDPDNYQKENYKVVATLATSLYWRDLIDSILPDGRKGIVIVFENECSPSFTYQIDGPKVKYLGRGDLHDTAYDHLVIRSNFFELETFAWKPSTYSGAPVDEDFCPTYLNVYPSDDMKAEFTTNNPIIFTVIAIAIFVFTSLVFVLYDYIVERRQAMVLDSATKTNAIVSSLFPSAVRDQLMEQEANKEKEQEKAKPQAKKKKMAFRVGNASSLDDFLKEEDERKTIFHKRNGREIALHDTKPLADLYPETTVFFADIAGFTAWSSIRDPCQVFTLLETLYGSFDKIAARRRVFKVETIGDCYVAVTGLPNPSKQHAVTMARFGKECLDKMGVVTKALEKILGPDTAELKLRVGLNSGPTTAGVLRGEKSRFQLFGDTVNTASRMESNGAPGRIHVSQKTADLLISSGKGKWVTPREDMIEAKGKGKLQTYWVNVVSNNAGSQMSYSDSDKEHTEYSVDDENEESLKMRSLIDWNAEVFEGLLKMVVALRPRTGKSEQIHPVALRRSDSQPLDEVTEVIEMNNIDEQFLNTGKFQKEKLDPQVSKQLRNFVATVAYMYRDNPFHNFEHASHVVMSTTKLLQRIEHPHPKIIAGNHFEDSSGNIPNTCDKNSHRIQLDPLAQFAIIFASLIHDCDHPGVGNMQLLHENSPLARLYGGKCIAEQNSVDMAWNLLLQPAYSELRHCIFTTEVEANRFRQIVVNAVIATDIFDKELKAFRDSRWEKAFCDIISPVPTKSEEDANKNRRATIVIEHIIQASDVVHTMQHWKIYQKWNERLFQEMYVAYKCGRSKTNPADGWYKGELWFFDNYIIPLAEKLRVCGVFGVSCDEFLDYARDNRDEWESKGQGIVAAFLKQTEDWWQSQAVVNGNEAERSAELEIPEDDPLEDMVSAEMLIADLASGDFSLQDNLRG